MEEHVDAEELLQELEGLDPEEDEWAATLLELREEVEHHVTAEEGEIFAGARKLLSEEQAQRLAKEFQAEKERVTF
jgi:hemerythrin-like domain-containing protein